MREFLKKNSWFIVPYLLVFLFASGTTFFFNKTQIHLGLNVFNNYFFDLLFKYITHLGDGIIIIPVVIVLCFVRYRYAIGALCSYLLSSLIVRVLKDLCFPGEPRPNLFFKGIADLHHIEGVDLHSYNSFPSGHASTAFAVFFVLSVISKNHYLKFLLFVLASLIAFSRVYLSQHFLTDVLFGSLIGLFSAVICMYLFMNKIKVNNAVLDLKWKLRN